MPTPSLSYIISTKNRLSFLKILFDRLLPQIEADEEIVVVDAASTDGSREYLEELYAKGKIQRFVSEPDQNQAQGWNKALLMARGTIIKKLIDDDVYCFEAIRKCRDHMLENPAIDLCISHVLNSSLSNPSQVDAASRLSQFEAWKSGLTKSFTFSDVSMLIRRSSLSFIGLYDTQFRMIDWEFALRASYLKAKIAYYTGFNALAVHTPGNVTSGTDDITRKKEEALGKLKYEYPGDAADINLYSKFKIWGGKVYYGLTRQQTIELPADKIASAELELIYASFYQTLEDKEHSAGGEIIF